MGRTYETQSEQGFCRIRLKMAETYALRGFEYDLSHVAEPVPDRAPELDIYQFGLILRN